MSVVVLQLGKTDLTSAAGQLIRKFLGAVAQMEGDMLAKRIRAGMARGYGISTSSARQWSGSASKSDIRAAAGCLLGFGG